MPCNTGLIFDDSALGGYDGLCKDLLDEIVKRTGFSVELYVAPDGKFGDQDPESLEWTGAMRELIEGKADLAIGDMSITAKREQFVDFTIPFYDLVGFTILMKKHREESNIFKFLFVMSETAWILGVCCLVAVAVLLTIYDKLSPYSYQNFPSKYKDDYTENKVFNIKESLWFCFTSMTAQGGGDVPKFLCGQILGATWWIFGFIFVASFTANLAAFLTVGRLQSGIQDLDDLTHQEGVK